MVTKKKLTCRIRNAIHTINLGHTESDLNQCEQYINLQKPVFNLVDKIASNGQATGSKLTANQQKRLDNILNKYVSVFKNEHTITSVYEHKIHVVEENKFVRKTYPIPLHYQRQVEEEINKMLNNNIIERADSNFLNPMVVIKKKNNDIRICLDMRNLNTITQKCYDCAPNAKNLFVKCQGVEYMSRLDLKSGFWQIPLALSLIHI